MPPSDRPPEAVRHLAVSIPVRPHPFGGIKGRLERMPRIGPDGGGFSPKTGLRRTIGVQRRGQCVLVVEGKQKIPRARVASAPREAPGVVTDPATSNHLPRFEQDIKDGLAQSLRRKAQKKNGRAVKSARPCGIG